jgi:hypothetical protein
VKFGDVAVLFEPLDEAVPVRRSSGTQVVSATLPAADDRDAAPERSDLPASAPRSRRPIRAAAPRPSGPPAWLITALVIGGGVAAYFLLH